MKKLLAILCAVALVFCSLFTGVVVAAEDPALTVYKPSTLTMGGQETGVVQGNFFTGGASSASTPQGLVNAQLQAKVVVGTGLNYPAYIGFNNPFLPTLNGDGFKINFTASGITVANQLGYDVSALAINDINPMGNVFDLTLTSVVVEDPGEGQAKTYKITLQVNDIIRETTVVDTVQDTVGGVLQTGMFPYLNFLNLSNVVVYDTDYVFPDSNYVTDPTAHLKKITLDDFTGFAPGEHYSYGNASVAVNPATDWGYAQTSIFDAVFEADVMLDVGGYIKYPTFPTWGGILLAVGADGKTLYLNDDVGIILPSGGTIVTKSASEFGYPEFYGKTFNYKVALEHVNDDGGYLVDAEGTIIAEGIKDDIKLTYYINNVEIYSTIFNGTQAEGTVATAVVNAETGVTTYEYELVGGEKVFNTDYGAANIVSAINASVNLPTNIPKLPVVTFGSTGDAGDWATKLPETFETPTGASWFRVFKPNTLFSVDVDTHGAYEGLNLLTWQLGMLSISWGRVNYTDLVDPSRSCGIIADDDYTAYGQAGKFNIKLSWQQADFNNDGIANDIVLGIFINDNYKFIEYPNAYTDVYNLILGTYNAVEFSKPAAVDAPVETDPFAGFQKVTLEDLGIAHGTYTNVVAGALGSSAVPVQLGASLNNKHLSTTVKFVNDGVNEAQYLSLLGDVGGYCMRINNAGWLMLVVNEAADNPAGQPYVGVNKAVALSGFVVGEANQIDVTYKYVNDALDIRIWINGVDNGTFSVYGMGTNKYSSGAGGMHKVGFYVMGSGAGHDFELGTPAVTNKDVAAEDNSFVVAPVEGKTVTVNGEAVAAETTLTAIGEYVISTVTTTAGFVNTNEKVYVIYKDKDLSGDSVVDILDFIIAKKNAGGTRPLDSKVALAAAGKTSEADLITPAELIAIKRAVLFG
ncbi:MAG: hypothetical protein PUF48_02815 [Oscillospiraceae bacterium]|nr:hypothetical protein [Oscillospiraceae bacterium]